MNRCTGTSCTQPMLIGKAYPCLTCQDMLVGCMSRIINDVGESVVSIDTPLFSEVITILLPVII